MKHTPGPWTVQECSNGGMLLIRPARESERTAIQSHVQILPAEDAKLMAAAPEMLEVLQWMHPYFCQTMCDSRSGSLKHNDACRQSAELLKRLEAK